MSSALFHHKEDCDGNGDKNKKKDRSIDLFNFSKKNPKKKVHAQSIKSTP